MSLTACQIARDLLGEMGTRDVSGLPVAKDPVLLRMQLLRGTEPIQPFLREYAAGNSSHHFRYAPGGGSLDLVLTGELAALPCLLETATGVSVEILDGRGGDGTIALAILKYAATREAGPAVVRQGAMSAHGLLFVCWSGRRLMDPKAVLMLHRPRSACYGTTTQVLEQARAMGRQDQKWADLILERADRNPLAAEVLRRVGASEDVHLTAPEALEAGLCDQILPQTPPTNLSPQSLSAAPVARQVEACTG